MAKVTVQNVTDHVVDRSDGGIIPVHGTVEVERTPDVAAQILAGVLVEVEETDKASSSASKSNKENR